MLWKFVPNCWSAHAETAAAKLSRQCAWEDDALPLWWMNINILTLSCQRRSVFGLFVRPWSHTKRSWDEGDIGGHVTCYTQRCVCAPRRINTVTFVPRYCIHLLVIRTVTLFAFTSYLLQIRYYFTIHISHFTIHCPYRRFCHTGPISLYVDLFVFVCVYFFVFLFHTA